jgi:SAM-dependent methyltransferase
MTLHYLEYTVSSGLADEIRAHQPFSPDAFDRSFPSLSAFLRAYSESVAAYEFLRSLREHTAALHIVDVGVGSGRSSLLLALLGHRVTVVEPLPALCEQVAYAGAKFGVPLEIYVVTGEEMQRIPDRNVDLVFFNSSLHHCDDPVGALRNAYTLLRPQGSVWVLNEPHLPFYRSRAWYMRRLHESPLEAGHYGGNEHIYSFHEYVRMLREAGFTQITQRLNQRLYRPRMAIEQIVNHKINRWPVYSAEALFVRLGWFLLMERLLRAPVLGGLVERALTQLSLAAISYRGIKPA